MSAPEGRPRLALHSGAGASLNVLGGRYLCEYLDKIELAVEDLDEAAMWRRSGPGNNSIANLILHLCGNLSLWILAGLGNQAFERDRAAEFAADHTAGKEELLECLRRVVGESWRVFTALDSAGMDVELEVQGYSTDGRGVVFHAVEHMSYHAGQIVLLAKQMLPVADGLEFYPHHQGE